MTHRRTLLLVTIILLISFGIRVWQIAEVPGGFSEEELTGIRIIENIRAGTIFVFFDDGAGVGTESLYYAVSVTITRFIGDGLLGYRVFSLWLGLLTLALLFSVARRLLGRTVALLALITAGVALWPIILSRTATHDAAVPFLILVVMWTVSQAYYLRQRIYTNVPITLSYAWLGIAIALVTYVHPTGFLAGLAVFIFALQLGRGHPRLARDLWWNSGYALLMAVTLGIPYIISIVRNLNISGPYIYWLERPESINGFLESALNTVGAFFWQGDTNPAHNIPGLPLTQLLEPVFLIIGLIIVIRRRHRPNYRLLLIFFVLGLLPDMWLKGGPNFRMLGFIMPAMYILIGLGILETIRIVQHQVDIPARLKWMKNSNFFGPWPRPLVGAVIVLITVAYGVNAYRVQNHLFDEWPQRADTQFAFNTGIGKVALYLDRTARADQTLVCTRSFESIPLSAFDQEVSDGQILSWMMHREGLPYRLTNCRNDFVFIQGGQVPMDIIFTDPTDLNVLPPPLLSWFRQAEPRTISMLPGDETQIWRLNTGQILQTRLAGIFSESSVYYPRDASGDLESVNLPLNFEGNLTFLGFEPLSPVPDTYHPGDILVLTTYWRVDGDLPSDIGIFIRLHDIPQASPYTEINLFEADANRLQPGDIILQVGYLTLPQQLRPAEYLLTMGLYEGLTVNQRQVLDTETRVPRGTYVLLGQPFQVQTQ